jgi:hypothetical protein
LDPDPIGSVDPGPDPDLQCFVSGFIDSGFSILGWMPIGIRIQCFDDQKLKKSTGTAENFFLYFFDQKLPFTFNGPPQRTSMLQEKPPDIKERQHPALDFFF